jgi:hypothetical protein
MFLRSNETIQKVFECLQLYFLKTSILDLTDLVNFARGYNYNIVYLIFTNTATPSSSE